jgi:two-component system, LuxR family, sensor kinase FixL
VMVAAAFGGLGPGLLVVGLATVANNYYFMPPFGTFSATREQLLRLVLFIIEGVFISVICARMKSARIRAEESESDARELEKNILEISDAEQRRIGHDLHDGLGQHLTGIALITRRLQNHLTASASPDAAEAEKLSQLAKSAVEWTHDLCRSLSPPALESAGLAEALRELASNLETIFNVDCTFELSGAEPPSDLSSGVHLYRIVQEAASNAIRHGQAKHVQIKLQTTSDVLNIQVIDDGKGIANAVPSADGMGLRIMRYRARMIGATIEVQDREGGGTIVRCCYVRPGQIPHGNQP